MNNKKYYPFERNNYFYGKLLTVRDFEDEQRYFNGKRKINNVLTAGAGVVSGLNVLMLDEKTVSIEAGMALDYMGREIIVEEAVAKKLNVIDGFEDIKDVNNVYLCLEYEQKGQEAVHSITGTASSIEDKSEFNRISEGYRLFLTDTVKDETSLSLNRLMIQKQVIYNNNGIKITQSIPKYAKPQQQIEIEVVIEKSDLPRIIEVDYSFTSEYFKSLDGDKRVRVYYKDEDIEAFKTIKLKYSVIAEDLIKANAEITIDKANSRVSIGSVGYMFDLSSKYDVKIVEGSINDYIIAEYMSMHFDEILSVGSENTIYLAKMRIIEKEKRYSIEAFEAMPFKQYVLSNSMLYMLMKEPINVNEVHSMEDTYKEVAATKPVIEPIRKMTASGQEIIEIDARSKNKTYYSDEIAHGLGSGDVLITVAVEEDDTYKSIFDINKSIFGDMEVFKGSPYEVSVPSLSTGIISYMDKGTFRIGVKFNEDSQANTIKLKWWAEKNSMNREEDILEDGNITISIEPDTVTVVPREKFKFEANITGTSNKECRWSVTDKTGGQIDFNGVYEAPTQEGVYEIVVESIKYPNKKATAFVVVKQR